MIAIKMNSKTAAIDFVQAFHGKKFNSIEPEECLVSILTDAYIENRKPNLTSKGTIFDKASLEAQECLFEDDLEQINCPICLENLFQSTEKKGAGSSENNLQDGSS